MKRDAFELVGRTVGGTFRLISKLGAGGMGTVWRAEDVRLEREVALKILDGDECDAEMAERFQREARLLASFHHPNLPVVFAFGKDGDLGYIALELVPGRSLAHLIASRREAVPAARACYIALQILGALGTAHDHGVVHRDVKPANVVVAERDGRDVVKLVDFGLAKDPARPALHPTDPKVVVGTPNYMSPEQARGKVDARSDLYSLGVVLYEMLSLRRPFEGNFYEVVTKQIHDAAPPLGGRVPAGLSRAVARSLEKDPARRYASAAQFAEALAEFAADYAGAKDEPEDEHPPDERIDPPSTSKLDPFVVTG